MCREVVGHAQARWQIQYPKIVADQVVVMDMSHPDLPQRQHQSVVFGINGKCSLQALVCTQLLQQNLAALLRGESEENGMAAQMVGQFGDMP